MTANPIQAIADGTFNQNNYIIEHLRIHVSKENKQAWLNAERATWQPWLEKQKGFINRQLLWDPINEEATLLITWRSRSEWKSIPKNEINTIQKDFEKLSKEATGRSMMNPFPLEFEGELIPY